VANYRHAFPDRRIYLVGHSAGCHVILAAAAYLPANSVDHIVLLAPSVSACYDLRPALRCARGGIDSYFSREDNVLITATGWYGTADGHTGAIAGLVGFACPHPASSDAGLYAKLRQFGWDRSVARTGYLGGHYGATRSAFLASYVLPRMMAGGTAAYLGGIAEE
jgi:pimeloyl-ACP methyl ester carboxylesterase